MNELQQAAAAVAAIKSLGDLFKASLDVHGAIKEQGKVFELQRVIIAAHQSALAAQEAQAALLKDKNQFEERVRQLEAWDGEKERYQLAEVGSGTLAFVIKPEAKGSDPFHMLCAKCYEQKRKSYLQKTPLTHHGRGAYQCHSCNSVITVSVDKMRALNPEDQ